MRPLALSLLLLAGCAHVELREGSTSIWTLGQVSVATGCPAATTDLDNEFVGLRAEAGFGEQAGQCASVLGGPLSAVVASIISSIAGLFAGLAAAGAL